MLYHKTLIVTKFIFSAIRACVYVGWKARQTVIRGAEKRKFNSVNEKKTRFAPECAKARNSVRGRMFCEAAPWEWAS